MMATHFWDALFCIIGLAIGFPLGAMFEGFLLWEPGGKDVEQLEEQRRLMQAERRLLVEARELAVERKRLTAR